MKRALRERLRARTIKAGDCWLWMGRVDEKGYGRVDIGGRERPVHRVMWEEYFGPMPEDLESHHVCGHRDCINPEHIVALSRAEHMSLHPSIPAIGNKTKQSCVRGHPFSRENTYIKPDGERVCRACALERGKRTLEVLKDYRKSNLERVRALERARYAIVRARDPERLRAQKRAKNARYRQKKKALVGVEVELTLPEREEPPQF